MDEPLRTGDPASADPLYVNAPCGLLVTTEDGLIRRANRTFCAWIGRDVFDLVDKVKVQELLTMGGRIFHQTHWTPLLQMQGSVAEVKLEVVHTDGHRIPMVWNAVRRVVGSETTHELAVFVATDRHKYEQELMLARRRAEELLQKEQQAQKDVRDAQAERDRQQALAQDRALFAEQMVAIVSHDLRNPLTVIRLSAHLIERGELSSRQQRALARLNSSSARAARLIADLLDFSQARIGSGLQVVTSVVDLHELVAEAVEDLRIAFPKNHLVHLQSGSGHSRLSADRLIQMIGNLVANASAHGAPDGQIVVTSTGSEHGCSVEVHNQGLPIPVQLLPTLFDPMTRGDPSDVGTHSIGLGLFIVREIVKAHGGDVKVTSSVDHGTSFIATFPRSQPERPDAPR